MTKKEKLALLEEIFEMEEGELKEELELDGLDSWDSMTMLSLIVLMDDEFEKSLTGGQIKKFITVQDVLNFMEN